MDLEKLYNTITCNGSREMTLERFKQAIKEYIQICNDEFINAIKDFNKKGIKD